MIGWKNNRDCDITMPPSLKTMEVQIEAKGTNEIRGLERYRSTGKFKGINVFSRVKECTLLQCFAYGCVGICRVSYFDSVRDYLLSGI